MRMFQLLVLLTAGFLLPLAGCAGGSSPSEDSGPSVEIELEDGSSGSDSSNTTNN